MSVVLTQTGETAYAKMTGRRRVDILQNSTTLHEIKVSCNVECIDTSFSIKGLWFFTRLLKCVLIISFNVIRRSLFSHLLIQVLQSNSEFALGKPYLMSIVPLHFQQAVFILDFFDKASTH